MHVTKRGLGVNYIGGTGLVLGGVLVAQLLLHPPAGIPIWILVGPVPALALVSALYWLPRINLDDEQVWWVAQCSALGLELVTMLILAGTLLSNVVIGTGAIQAGLVASAVGTGAITGALVGALWELQMANRRMATRTDVLNRVLRHNLRNDMTVVLGHLEHVKENVDDPERAKLEVAQRKVDALVDLTEQVRQIDTALGRGRATHQPVDVVDCIDRRLDQIERTHPSVTVEVDCPPEAWVVADDMLGTLLDNIVESAGVHGDGDPSLALHVTTTSRWVELSITDTGHTLPMADLAAVAAGSETKLDHGRGIELWLVDWLVEKYDGELDIGRTEDGRSRIDITLPRANT